MYRNQNVYSSNLKSIAIIIIIVIDCGSVMMGQVRNPDCNSHTKPKGMYM